MANRMKSVGFAVPLLLLGQSGLAADQGDISPFWKDFQFHGDTVEMSLKAARQRTFLNELIVEPTDLAVKNAASAVTEADAAFDSTWTLAGSSTNSENTATPTQTISDTMSLTWSKSLSTGTTLSASGSYTKSDTTTSTTDLATDSYTKSLSVSQPLLKDGWQAVNKLTFWTAENTLKSTEYTHINTMASQYQAVTNAYWDHWLAFRSLNIAIEQYELAERQTVLAQKLSDAGLTANVEVLRAQTGVAQRVDAILQAQNSIIVTNNTLTKLVSSEEGKGDYILIRPVTEPVVTEPKVDKTQLLDDALKNSLALKILEKDADTAELTLEAAEHQLLPEVDFSASYSETDAKTDNTSVKFNSSEKDDWSVGLTLTYPFMQREDNENYKQARIGLKTSEYSVATERQNIVKNVDAAINSIYQSYRSLVAATAEEDITGRIYEAELKQFNRGEQTSTDVLNAAQQLAVAQNKKASAMVNFEKNKTQIDFIRGTLNTRVLDFLNMNSTADTQ